MADKNYKAFIVEGEAREPLIINNISKVFFSHGNFRIITLPAGQNIYMLWKKLSDDEFETDIIEVLREMSKETAGQLDGLGRDDFSEVYLFFDYDGHQNNLSADEDGDVLDQMLLNFDNETENGKLYISYPMVEALRDFEPGKCGDSIRCLLPISEIGNYKTVSATALYPQFDRYNYEMWKEIIDVYSMRLSCLMNEEEIISYNTYVDTVTPRKVQLLEKRECNKGYVFILSAFPEFLLDYYGIRLWKTCVKHTGNQLSACIKKHIRGQHIRGS